MGGTRKVSGEKALFLEENLWRCINLEESATWRASGEALQLGTVLWLDDDVECPTDSESETRHTEIRQLVKKTSSPTKEYEKRDDIFLEVKNKIAALEFFGFGERKKIQRNSSKKCFHPNSQRFKYKSSHIERERHNFSSRRFLPHTSHRQNHMQPLNWPLVFVFIHIFGHFPSGFISIATNLLPPPSREVGTFAP